VSMIFPWYSHSCLHVFPHLQPITSSAACKARSGFSRASKILARCRKSREKLWCSWWFNSRWYTGDLMMISLWFCGSH
jgi:hypothetical protein